MNRRDFLKATLATIAAKSLEIYKLTGLADVAPKPAGFPASLVASIQQFQSDLNEHFYCLVHPKVLRRLRDRMAREYWRTAYRRYREDGRPADLSPREIMAKYHLAR